MPPQGAKTCGHCNKSSTKGRNGPFDSAFSKEWFCDTCWSSWDRQHGGLGGGWNNGGKAEPKLPAEKTNPLGAECKRVGCDFRVLANSKTSAFFNGFCSIYCKITPGCEIKPGWQPVAASVCDIKQPQPAPQLALIASVNADAAATTFVAAKAEPTFASILADMTDLTAKLSTVDTTAADADTTPVADAPTTVDTTAADADATPVADAPTTVDTTAADADATPVADAPTTFDTTAADADATPVAVDTTLADATPVADAPTTVDTTPADATPVAGAPPAALAPPSHPLDAD